ncbi:MAG: TonB-dependent receptor plug domain-containing protein, partial [Gammaproteobacteria bacterium]|nr:TonB-dependent receptor plug domain-containing protein [Gammaproteobacteria bacterium]
MFRKKQLCLAITLATAGATSSPATAQIEEIMVTATKREQSMQDVPVAVSAITEENLEQLGISNFEDYLLQLPTVTAGGSGPGQNTIYIRGIASTTPNLTTAGVSGLVPNVALYLDEQPLSQPGRNLDVYAADLARIETLSGPQGTLFGASSQAGTVRLITNKPDPNDSYGSIKAGGGYMSEGDPSSNFEGMFNLPVSDTFTVRGVLYQDKQGGYIDNVAGTRDLTESARFREAGTLRDNGEPVSVRRSGLQSASSVAAALEAGDTLVGERVADFSNVTFLEADNSNLVEKDFNETTYTGGRLSGLWDINTDWSLLVAHSQQEIESDGVFFADPDLGDLEVQRFEGDKIEDKFNNTNWTLTGRLGELEVLYTGAFTDRETEQRVDYTDYMFVGQYLPYYICDTTVTYPEYNSYYEGFTDGLPGGICQAPNLFVDSETNTQVTTHEIRFTTDGTGSIRATGGAFLSDLELEERNDFTYPGSTEAITFGSQGFFPGFPFPGGYSSDPGPFPADVMFRNDIRRTDEQYGVFGEVTFDIGDQLELTLGARYYDISVDFEGSANAQFCNSFQEDADRFGTNLNDLYDGDGQFTFINDCTAGGNITFTQGQTFQEIQSILAEADPYSFARGRNVSAPNAISDGEIE